ncbi:MAG: glycosyl hydrolase family protein [Deltaproteobacteria bacterium]|nr:MAG: glycosyl hydrolase family protein [Deltaproteobacteria bacterium]
MVERCRHGLTALACALPLVLVVGCRAGKISGDAEDAGDSHSEFEPFHPYEMDERADGGSLADAPDGENDSGDLADTDGGAYQEKDTGPLDESDQEMDGEDQHRLPAGLAQGRWDLVWQDEFDGPAGQRPAPHWFFFDGWDNGGKWRDAFYTDGEHAMLDGLGHLVLEAVLVGGELHTAYLTTYDWSVPQEQWTTFGPRDGLYLEAAVRLDGLEAGGLWTAFWLFDPSDTYDGDPSTGTEIDIMEYLIAYGAEGSWTAQLPGGNTLDLLNVAHHWTLQDSESRMFFASDYGVDLRDGGFHRFGVEWHRGLLVWYVDGQEVFRTTNHVSTSDGEALVLSIEYDEGPGDAWGLNENVHEYSDRLPDVVVVDYVRVYARTP